MKRYYFHVTDGRRVYPDPEGIQLAGIAAARMHARSDAGHLLASWMRLSSAPWRIEVVDDEGVSVFSIPVQQVADTEALAV